MGLFKQLIVKEEKGEVAKENPTTAPTTPTPKAITIETAESDTKGRQKIKVFDTSPNEDFWFHYGPVVKNLAELRDAFLRIDDDLYNYHAKGEANDFARWVESVFGYEELAKELERAKTRKKAYKILEDAVE